jgi:hypothetical protein
MNGIDPKFTFWFGVWTNVLMLIAGYGVEHAPPLVAQFAPDVQWLAGFFSKVNGVVLTALIGLSSDKLGPLVKVPLDAVKPIIILAVLLTGLFAFSGVALAQGIKVRLPAIGQAATQAPTPRAASTDPLSKFMDDLAKVQQDVVAGVTADITAADADAATLINPSDPTSFRDPIAHACYPAEIKFLQSLPVATPPTGKFVLVQLFQKKRDFVAQIKAGLPDYLKLGCAALLGDEIAILTKSLSLIGVSVAANALLPGAGFAIPTL